MLLTGYTKEVFRPECNPSFESVHCIARLNEDVGPVLPYLNAVLGGTQYFSDPPEVMFHHHGRLIKVIVFSQMPSFLHRDLYPVPGKLSFESKSLIGGYNGLC